MTPDSTPTGDTPPGDTPPIDTTAGDTTDPGPARVGRIALTARNPGRRRAAAAGLGLVCAGLAALVVADPAQAAGPAAAGPATAQPPASPPTAGQAPTAITLPPANAVVDYQIGGAYPPAPAVGIVDRDHTESPAAGLYNVCYVNAFQSQPGESGQWPAGTILTSGGTPVEDPGWPGEYLLDTRTPTSRAAIDHVLHGWLADCAGKGYKAIEPDNLDSWDRSHNLLTPADNLAMATLLTADAHRLGLAVAQKNAAEQAPAGRSQAGFDFAVAEECQANGDECGSYTDVYGRQVYEIEYDDNGGTANFQAACRDHGATISITYRDRGAVPAGEKGYLFEHC